VELGVATGGHSATGYQYDPEYLRSVAEQGAMRDRWKGLTEGRPPVVRFWYRQSPRPLVSSRISGRVTPNDPPLADSNMAGVRLDTTGRLLELYRVPLQHEEGVSPVATAAFDWSRLFAAARLDLAAFRPAATQWTPYVNCETHLAWVGTSPDWPEVELRVEAGSWRGQPNWFKILAPWKRAERQEPMVRTGRQMAGNAIGISVLVFGLIASGLVARRNLRLGSGDRRGATTLATFVIGGALIAWALGADHVTDIERELELFARGLGQAVLVGAVVAVFYLALEPQLRRLWPHALISWTRLLAGRFGDSLVGAHALYGMACGLLMTLVRLGFLTIDVSRMGPNSDAFALDTLLGLSQTLDWILERALFAIGGSLMVVLLFAAVRLFLRWQPLAILVAISPFVLQDALNAERPLLITLPLLLLVFSVPLIALARFGLVAMMFTFFTTWLLNNTPLTPWLSHWSAGPTQAVLLTLATLAAFALRAATRRDPLVTTSSSSRG
jgi:hypothetical protein